MCCQEKKTTFPLNITIKEYFDNPQPEVEITVDNTSIRVYTTDIDAALELLRQEIMKRLKK